MFLCILEMVNTVLSRRRTDAVRGDRAPAPLLDGIRRADWTARPDAARRLGALLAERGEVAYSVAGADAQPAADRRVHAGFSMRLRPAKRLGATLRYLRCDRVLDRWLDDLRRLRPRNLGLPRRLAAPIDETRCVRRPRAGSRQGLLVGVRLRERPPAAAPMSSGLIAPPKCG
jgi:hypothetical protein